MDGFLHPERKAWISKPYNLARDVKVIRQSFSQLSEKLKEDSVSLGGRLEDEIKNPKPKDLGEWDNFEGEALVKKLWRRENYNFCSMEEFQRKLPKLENLEKNPNFVEIEQKYKEEFPCEDRTFRYKTIYPIKIKKEERRTPSPEPEPASNALCEQYIEPTEEEESSAIDTANKLNDFIKGDSLEAFCPRTHDDDGNPLPPPEKDDQNPGKRKGKRRGRGRLLPKEDRDSSDEDSDDDTDSDGDMGDSDDNITTETEESDNDTEEDNAEEADDENDFSVSSSPLKPLGLRVSKSKKSSKGSQGLEAEDQTPPVAPVKKGEDVPQHQKLKKKNPLQIQL